MCNTIEINDRQYLGTTGKTVYLYTIDMSGLKCRDDFIVILGYIKRHPVNE